MKNLKISKIQKKLQNKSIDCLIINRTDEFLNEYIANDSERLFWATDFSGSAGRAIITQDKSYLFVDGRYTSQAKEQVDKSIISLMHLNNFTDELNKNIIKGKCIGLDPKLHTISEMFKIIELVDKQKANLYFTTTNIIDEVWNNRPKRSYGNIFDHPVKFAGIDSTNKIKSFQDILKKNNLDNYFLSSLDSIAWLLNLRGFDILHTPLVFSFLFVSSKSKPVLYLSINKLNIDLKNRLCDIVSIKCIDEIDNVFNDLENEPKIGFDYKNTSYYFYDLALQNKGTPFHLENPCLFPKATKNDIELDGTRKAHIRDGVSITKFLYWLKTHENIEEENEISVANKLLFFREKNELFHSISFDTISAIGKTAALPHYRADINNPIPMKKNSIYLSDSGGQYYDGTTDITRTIILGTPNNEQKEKFTRVLKGLISLTSHIFSKGTTGTDIDKLARESLLEVGCDYDHGTGHGIGSFLSVHEAPQRISKKSMLPSIELLPGMILSNEPGFYKEGEFGIRIENIVIVQKASKGLLKFENISWAPIDRDLIKSEMLSINELEWINNYHQAVYDKLFNFITPEEKRWLQKVTMPL